MTRERSIAVTQTTLEAVLAKQGAYGFSCNPAGEVWSVNAPGFTSSGTRQLIRGDALLNAIVEELLERREKGGRFTVSPSRATLAVGGTILVFEEVDDSRPAAVARDLVQGQLASLRKQIRAMRERRAGRPIAESRRIIDQGLLRLRRPARELGDLELIEEVHAVERELHEALGELANRVADEATLRRRIGSTQTGDFEPG